MSSSHSPMSGHVAQLKHKTITNKDNEIIAINSQPNVLSPDDFECDFSCLTYIFICIQNHSNQLQGKQLKRTIFIQNKIRTTQT